MSGIRSKERVKHLDEFFIGILHELIIIDFSIITIARCMGKERPSPVPVFYKPDHAKSSFRTDFISDYVRIAVFQIECDEDCDIFQKVRINMTF